MTPDNINKIPKIANGVIFSFKTIFEVAAVTIGIRYIYMYCFLLHLNSSRVCPCYEA